MRIIKQFSLDTLDMKTVGVFNNYDSLCDSLVKEFNNISKSTIAREEEGAVFYFIKRDPTDASA